jgi:hypothetical protein
MPAAASIASRPFLISLTCKEQTALKTCNKERWEKMELTPAFDDQNRPAFAEQSNQATREMKVFLQPNSEITSAIWKRNWT